MERKGEREGERRKEGRTEEGKKEGRWEGRRDREKGKGGICSYNLKILGYVLGLQAQQDP